MNTPIEKTVLEVVSNTFREDKNGAPYNYVEVKTFDKMEQVIAGVKRMVRTPSRVMGFTAYPHSYLTKDENGMPTGEAQFGHDLTKGEIVQGSIITRSVEAYVIEKEGKEDTTATTATVVVFGDVTNEAIIQRAFTGRGFVLTGEVVETVSEELATAESVDSLTA